MNTDNLNKETWKYNDGQKKRIRELIAGGMSLRGAYRKMERECKKKDGVFNYDANYSKGMWV